MLDLSNIGNTPISLSYSDTQFEILKNISKSLKKP